MRPTPTTTRRRIARRRAAVAITLVALGSTTACGGDDALPDADDVRSIDLTPSKVLTIDERYADDDEGRPDEVEIQARAVLEIRNADDEPHRLVGDGFDTGLLEPGDETLVTFPEPATIVWSDRFDGVGGTITVVAGDGS